MEYDEDDILVFQDVNENKEEVEKALIRDILMTDYNVEQEIAEEVINQLYKYRMLQMPESIVWLIGASSYLTDHNIKLNSPINKEMFNCKKRELKTTKITCGLSNEYLSYIEQIFKGFIKKDKHTIKNLYYKGMTDMFYIKNINYITYPGSKNFDYLKHLFMEDISYECADLFDLIENIIENEYQEEFDNVDLFDLMINNIEYIDADLDPYIKIGRLFLINYIDKNNLEFEDDIKSIILEDETVSNDFKNEKNFILVPKIKEKQLSQLSNDYYLS